jgi:hypothetical protein
LILLWFEGWIGQLVGLFVCWRNQTIVAEPVTRSMSRIISRRKESRKRFLQGCEIIFYCVGKYNAATYTGGHHESSRLQEVFREPERIRCGDRFAPMHRVELE